MSALARAPASAPASTSQDPDDPGVQVEMFENPTLDRFLRRAQDFLGRNEFAQAIRVLQDVIEGKTSEIVGDAPPPLPPPTAPNPSASPPAPKERPARDAESTPDARQSVFSSDGRLFRPVRRLCHELLARLPAVGLELYRASFEGAANEMLEDAIADGSTGALEAVVTRYFVTLPAGRAMALLADRLMHEGRPRAAVQVLHDLIDVYPAENRRRLGISDVWCGFKIVLCLRLANDPGAAHAAAVRLAEKFPGETLRILGELQAVADLPKSEMLGLEALTAGPRRTADEPSWLSPATEELVPLWQYRFRNPDPYRDPKAANENNRVTAFFDESNRAVSMPFANRYGGGTWISFENGGPGGLPRALFFEHFRLRVADVLGGLMAAQGDQPDDPPPARENHPRIRIATSDFALLRPVEDEERCYAIIGYRGKTSATVDVLKASELVACRRGTLERAWSSTQWLEGEGGLRDVTFLAAPTVSGERLLLPAMRRRGFSLECLDRSTGRPLWNVRLHAGGSQFFKPPGVPVVVAAGTAFVATNAGCIAAVDSFTGDLRWIRRYERTDPVRPVRRSSTRSREEEMAWSALFQQAELPGFLPNDLVVSNGTVVFAACDSNLVMCLDGATGQPLWWVDSTTRHAPFRPLRSLVGIANGDLFAVGDRHLVCIGLEGGLVKWHRELPPATATKGTRGRGLVVGDEVVLPSDGELLVFDAAGVRPMRRIRVPSFDASRDPLSGPCTLSSQGPWLAVGYPGGVELLSSRGALSDVAASCTDPLTKADLLVAACDGAAAEALLASALRADGGGPRRRVLAERLLGLVRGRAIAVARTGDLKTALAALDAVQDLMPPQETRLRWHLARLDLCKAAGNPSALEREQIRLYDLMEGRG